MRRTLLSCCRAVIMAAFIMAIGGVDNVARSQSSLPAPTGVSAVNGDTHGEAVVSWQAVADAAYYRIGWMADEDYQAALSGVGSGMAKRVPLLQRHQPGPNSRAPSPGSRRASNTGLLSAATVPSTGRRNGHPGRNSRSRRPQRPEASRSQAELRCHHQRFRRARLNTRLLTLARTTPAASNGTTRWSAGATTLRARPTRRKASSCPSAPAASIPAG